MKATQKRRELLRSTEGRGGEGGRGQRSIMEAQRELTNNKFISNTAIPLTDCNKQAKSFICYTENWE